MGALLDANREAERIQADAERARADGAKRAIRVRASAIAAARDAGIPMTEIAAALGVTRVRVYQILNAASE